jgi:hypothetical protein
VTEHPETPGSELSADGVAGQPTAEQQTASWVPQPPPADGASAQEPVAAAMAERPELAVGAAFAGGLLAALILKRLAR